MPAQAVPPRSTWRLPLVGVLLGVAGSFTRIVIQADTKAFSGTLTVDSTSASSAETGKSSSTNEGPSSPTRTRIAIGVSIPIGLTLITSSLVFGIRRYRSKSHHTINPSDEKTAEQDPPYLQQKGELDASGNTVFEIDGRERRH
ncbi:MAG: hypothetical protein LQ349_007739, partial [Xanthoria aureola]